MKLTAIVILVLTLFSVSSGQRSLLTGTVYDQSGAVVTKTKVYAVAPSGEKFETITDELGSYSLLLPYSTDPKREYGHMKFEIRFISSDPGFKKGSDKVVYFRFIDKREDVFGLCTRG